MQSTLPPESLERVAELCRLRRERESAELQVWAQTTRFNAEHEAFVVDGRMSLEDEEETARMLLLKAEIVSIDRITSQLMSISGNSGTGHRAMDRETTQRRDQLLRQLHCMEFRSFWQQRAAPQVHASNGLTNAISTRRAAVTILRKAYEFSAPNFASDPEDLWKRGIAVAPDLQRQSHSVAPAPDLSLPAYHDFAIEMRHRYREYAATRVDTPQTTPNVNNETLRTTASSPFARFARTATSV